jgi:hypothetical protein
MSSVLNYERLFKRIPPFQDNFDSKFNMFRAKVTNRYGIENRYIQLINEVKEVIIQHRKSPMEFSRKDKLVICNGDYKMRTITVNNIKEYINNTKDFIEIMQKITLKNEDIFKV